MKNKFFLWLSLMITLSVILHSCRNEDLAKAEANPQRNNSDFFQHKSNLYAKTGKDYINILEAYNRETDFLSKMPDQRGMPVWDKMYEVVTEDAAGLMIPLSYDGETMSSILFVTLDGKDEVTGVKDYDNALLESIVYNQTISVENREKLFLTFMHMDNRTFGNEHFIGIPKDLFAGKKSNDEYGIMWIRDIKPSPKVTVQQEGKIMIIETCFIALHCTHHGTGNICDAEDGCTECGTTFCTYEVIGTADDPFPSSPGGSGGGGGGCFGCGGGGGGGGTPGPNVPTNPCGSSLNTVFYRLAPGCGGVGPGLPVLNDPCQKTNDMLARPDVQQGIANVKANAKLTVTNPTTGETGFKEKKDGTVVPTDVNSSHQVIFNDVTDGYGGYHNHTATGIHMVSPPDIVDTLFGFAAAQSVNDGVGNAYLGMIAAEPCNSCTDGVKYVHYVIRYAGTAAQLANFVYSPAQMTQIIKDYRKTASDLVDPYISGASYSNTSGDLNEKGLEKLFFDTLQNMGLAGKVVLQRIENNGTVYNVTKNSNGTITATPCP